MKRGNRTSPETSAEGRADLIPGRWNTVLIIAALSAIAFLVFPHGRIVADTQAKLERTARIEAEINARRAAHFAKVVAGCLNGEPITDGQRIVDCVARQ